MQNPTAILACLLSLTLPQRKALARALTCWAGSRPQPLTFDAARTIGSHLIGASGSTNGITDLDLAVIRAFAPIALNLCLGDKRAEAALARAYSRLIGNVDEYTGGNQTPARYLSHIETARDHIQALVLGWDWPPPPQVDHGPWVAHRCEFGVKCHYHTTGGPRYDSCGGDPFVPVVGMMISPVTLHTTTIFPGSLRMAKIDGTITVDATLSGDIAKFGHPCNPNTLRDGDPPFPLEDSIWVRIQDGLWFRVSDIRDARIYWTNLKGQEKGFWNKLDWDKDVGNGTIVSMVTVPLSDRDRIYHSASYGHPGSCKGCHTNPKTWGKQIGFGFRVTSWDSAGRPAAAAVVDTVIACGKCGRELGTHSQADLIQCREVPTEPYPTIVQGPGSTSPTRDGAPDLDFGPGPGPGPVPEPRRSEPFPADGMNHDPDDHGGTPHDRD